MRKDQLFEGLGEECSRERGGQRKGHSRGASGVCLRKRRLARRMWEVRRHGVRWEGSDVTQDLTGGCGFSNCAAKSLRGFCQENDRT